jgi:hypothetical protein
MTVDDAWAIVLDCRAYHAGELPTPDAFQTRADVDCDDFNWVGSRHHY